MDTTIWGPLLWPVLFDAIKFCDPKRVEMAALFSSLKRVLPCIYCRRSYRMFYTVRRTPAGPSRGTSTEDLYRWVHWLKSTVSKKLEIQSTKDDDNAKDGRSDAMDVDACSQLPIDKFLKRAHVWKSFGSISGFWDLLYIVALNYPEDARSALVDGNEDERKKVDGYRVFFMAIGVVFDDVPYAKDAAAALRGLNLAVTPAAPIPSVLLGRSALF